MDEELGRSIKKLFTKNGVASFALDLLLLTFLAGIIIVFAIAQAQPTRSVQDFLPAIIVIASGVMTSALFFALGSIIDRQNSIGILLLAQQNPAVQEGTLTTSKWKKGETDK